jgi:hypothetical protein
MRIFPDPSEIGPFGPAFIRLMFAYAELDRRFSDLQNTITGKNNFHERNQWSVEERPKKTRQLMSKNKKRLYIISPDEWKQISNTVSDALKRARVPSDRRNVLAHGHWWTLEAGGITVRREKPRRGTKRFECLTVAEIERAADELLDIEAALYQAQSAIKRLLDPNTGDP